MRRPPDILIRVVFELHFGGKNLVTQIQDRISAFSVRPLPALLEEGLAAFRADRLLVFEQVELEVGEVRLSRLEEDLAAGIAKCLRRWAFCARPSSSWPLLPQAQDEAIAERDRPRPQVGRRSQREPQPPASTPRGLNAAIAEALTKPGEWPEFLSVVRENHALRRRIADEVSPRLLRRLLAALVEDQGTCIADCAETLIRLHEHQPLMPVNIHVFRRGLWECIFAELAGTPRHQLTERAFIVSVLERLAASHLSTGLATAANLAKALHHQPPKSKIGDLLAEAICELKTQSVRGLHSGPSKAAISNDDNQPAAGASRRLNDLQTFLESGALPWSLTGRDAGSEILDVLAAAPHEVCLVIGDLSETESVRKRLAAQFSENPKSRLLIALAPSAGSWMISFMRQLRRIHAQKQLFALSNRQFGHDLWESCFEYLAQRKGKSFEPRSFLRHLLQQIASRRKTSYESLLSDLLVRRGPDLRSASAAGSQNTSLGRALVALFDQALFGTDELAPEIPQSLIDPEFRSLYSDLDVLAHWLRWHKLPHWSRADDPEETGRQLGSLLGTLPPHIQSHADRGPRHDRTYSTETGSTPDTFTPPEQIKHWLAFGLWPASVLAPDVSQLAAWLENQTDADWMKALEGDGPHEAMVTRLSHHVSPSLFERVIRLLAGRAAGLVFDYLRCLDIAGRHSAPVATQLWADQLKKYTLIYLLRTSSASGRHAISVVELARSTMLALSLNCRVSYERLLDGVEQQSRGQEEIESICRVLRQELETDYGAEDRKEPIRTSDRHEVRPVLVVPRQEPPQGIAPRHSLKEEHLSRPELIHSVSTNDPSARLAAFGEFLRSGCFPGSVEALSREPSRGWVTPYLSGNSRLLLDTLATAAVHRGALPRLMRYVAPNELEQLVRAAAPAYGGLLLLYISAGSRLPDGAEAAVTPRRSRSAGVHWRETLALLLDSHASRQSAAGALHALTVRVSRQMAMTHDQYLSALLPIARARRSENTGYAALADMLEQMLPDAAPAPLPVATASPVAGEQQPPDSSKAPGLRERQTRTLEASAEGSSQRADAALNETTNDAATTLVSGEQDDWTGHDEVSLGQPRSDDALAQLDYLLRYGELADHAPNSDREALMTRIAETLGARCIEYRRYLLTCAGREVERKRMAGLFPSHLLRRLWPLLVPSHHAEIALYVEVLEEAFPATASGNSGTVCHEIVVEELFKAISNAQARRWDGAAYLKSAVARLSRELSLRPPAFVKRVRTVLEKRPENTSGRVLALIERIELEFARMPRLRPAQNSLSGDTQPQPQRLARPRRSMPEGEPFYIANAGLVLLWPFLPPYFQRLGLIEKNTFRDEQAQMRAVYLLQYLTSGRLEAPEHALLLNKIIAGWAIEQPLDQPSPLTESEEALSEQLLQGVLKNWDKLKGTSVQGLRSSFLMREGKLLLKEDTWSLTVSNKAYDILLDSLPWSLAMIRLPWMKALLQVKWR